MQERSFHIPLPDKEEFDHPHQCSTCKKWSIFVVITYSEEKEKTEFFCENCKPENYFQTPIPETTEFRKIHECFKCERELKHVSLSYCPNCEEGEFTCVGCHSDWHDWVNPSQFGYDPLR